MAETIDEAELLRAAMEQGSRLIRVAMPGRVKSYNHSKRRADIELQLHDYISDGKGGMVAEKIAIIPNVKVAMPGGGGCFVSFPLQEGDPVEVIFHDLPLAAWFAKGEPTEAGDIRPHHFMNAVAHPVALEPKGAELQSPDGSLMRLGIDGDADAQVEFAAHEVRLGQGANEAIAIASKVKQDLAALMAAIVACTTPTPGGGAALKAAIVALNNPPTATWPNDYGSANAKAKP